MSIIAVSFAGTRDGIIINCLRKLFLHLLYVSHIVLTFIYLYEPLSYLLRMLQMAAVIVSFGGTIGSC